MKLVLEFDMHADVIEIPALATVETGKLKKDFLNWIYNKKSSKKHWKTVTDANGERFDAVMYDGQTFLDWLNKSRLKGGEKAVYLGRISIDEIDRALPCIRL